jgi:hypothetical protein
MGHARCTGAEVGDGAPMKPLARGDVISVVLNGILHNDSMRIIPCIVKKWGPKIRCVYVDKNGHHHHVLVRRNCEGRRWARGADGPEVEALHVATALL